MTAISSTAHRLQRFASERVFNMPLLIEPGRLASILQAIGPRIGVTELPRPLDTEMSVRPVAERSLEERRRRRRFMVEEGIAVIDIFGTLIHRAMPGEFASGGPLEYVELRDELIDAGTDPEIKGILLNIDSGGGEAGGCFDLADDVAQIAGLKPVWALSDSMAFSAAYCLGSQASRLIVTQDAGVGSVGVIALHVDQSEFNKKEGINVTAIFAGSHKNDFSPHEPLSSDAAKILQGIVDSHMSLFVEKVARGRGMSAEAVRRTEAGLFFGRDAVNVGFADAVGTFQSTFSEMREKVSGGSRERVALNAKSATPEVTTMKEETTPAGVEAAQPPVAAGGAERAVVAAAAKPSGLTSADQTEIMDLCALRGLDLKTARGFTAQGLTPAKVREQLINQLAEGQESTTVNAATMPNDGMNVNAGFLAGRMKATLAERGIEHGIA